MTLIWVLICTGIVAGMLWIMREVLKLPEDTSSSNESNEETPRVEPHF
jgi:hypothetical protein